jgi:hypothetical protein
MSRILPLLHAVLAASVAVIPGSLTAQTSPAGNRPQVMILGSYHMAGSGDHVQVRVDDVLAERRQREIEQVVESLAGFRPTRVALEVPVAMDSLINERYRRYLEGSHTLGRSESEQIGFRLAKRLGHERVYAVDYPGNEDIAAALGFAAQNGQMEIVQEAQAFMQRLQSDMERQQRTLTVGEILRELNSPETDAMESMYLLAATIGRGDRYVGADLVTGRHERNLKIFVNIARIAGPGDRVLAVYGSSHGKLLRQFVEESPMLELVRADPFLSAVGSHR